MKIEEVDSRRYWVDRVRTFLTEHAVEQRLATDTFERFPWEVRLAAGNEGLLGLDAALDDGGSGISRQIMGHLYVECGMCGINTRELIGLGHGHLIATQGTKRQRDEFLPPIMAGTVLAGVGITEPYCGSDMAAIRTFAKKTSGGYLLSGVKEWVSRIEEAKIFIIFAKTSHSSGVKGLSAFVVPMDSPGITTYTMEPMGLNGWSFGGLKIHNVLIPSEYLIGQEGQGFEIFSRHFNYWRTLMALISLGSAERSIQIARDHARVRDAFGGPLGRLQSVMHKIAESSTYIDAAKLLCFRALELVDRGEPCAKEVAMAKWYGTHVAHQAIDNTMQILGARGYSKEYGIEQRLRDARGLMIADGSNEVMKSIIGREMLGKDVYDSMYGRSEQIDPLRRVRETIN